MIPGIYQVYTWIWHIIGVPDEESGDVGDRQQEAGARPYERKQAGRQTHACRRKSAVRLSRHAIMMMAPMACHEGMLHDMMTCIMMMPAIAWPA